MFSDHNHFWNNVVSYCCAAVSVFITNISTNTDELNMEGTLTGILMAFLKLTIPLLTSIKLSWDLFNLFIKWKEARDAKSIEAAKKKIE